MTDVTKLVCVGYAPGPAGNLRAFDGPTGDRLAKLLGWASRRDVVERLECVNVLDREPMADGDPCVPKASGRTAADALAPRLHGRSALLCGVDVPRWFGLDPQPHFRWRRALLRGGEDLAYATIPHPSGLCRLWNQPSVRREAEAFLRESYALGPEGVREQVLEVSSALATIESADALITYEQAAAVLGLTRDHLRQLVHRRRVPHVRLSGRTVRFRRSDLAVFLARSTR